jgi:hypothetical protein
VTFSLDVRFAFSAIILLDHLDVGVVGEAVLADGGKVGRLPARAVQILLNLRRGHDGWVFCEVLRLQRSSAMTMLGGEEVSNEVSLGGALLCRGVTT